MASHGAFQRNAFQFSTYSFQLGRAPGDVGGARIAGGTFSRGRWRSLTEERERGTLERRRAAERALTKKRQREAARIAARRAAFAAELLADQQLAAQQASSMMLANALQMQIGMDQMRQNALASGGMAKAAMREAERQRRVKEEEDLLLLLMS